MSETTTTTWSPARAVSAIASSCGLPGTKVAGAVALLSEGNTLPFIARYRKEATGGLSEIELRAVEDSLTYFRDLEARKETVLRTIDEQGQLDSELRRKILELKDRKALEELYLPFRPRRRTRATIARERGLEPLAELLLETKADGASREAILAPFVSAEREVPDTDAALAGALDILAERWADEAEPRAIVRREMERGALASRVKRDWKGKKSKFENYYAFRAPLERLSSHQFLAIRRGEAEKVLAADVQMNDDATLKRLRSRLAGDRSLLFQEALSDGVGDCYTRLLRPSLETEVLGELRERAEEEAIRVFAQNLRDLLLAAPAGPRVVLGIDPGFRTGCKLAVVDRTGKFLENATIYPTAPLKKTDEASRVVVDLIERHSVDLIAIGNGTASRETDAFVAEVMSQHPLKISKVTVSEAGASVYSASETAVAEYPDLDVTVRGAISIAHRLQDPLAALVKIDPKSIGVGQYQHDVNQKELRRALDREVESCVNQVGVDLNTASVSLLSYVAGIGPKLADSIQKYRDQNGAFQSRKDLLAVPRLGGRAFQQAAGFLRVRDGREPLDNSAVHPESYGVVVRMAKSLHADTASLIGNAEFLSRLDPKTFVDDTIGLPTVKDILEEIEKPGRDPRAEFRVVKFQEGVNEVSDVSKGMRLEGVVTNVTRFGAFVDVGVHQDGLVHISELDTRFVKDPADVVSVGDIVQVEVLEVDTERGRIALSRKRVLN